MDPPSEMQAYSHSKSGETVLPILKEFLPYSLPLYRRLQFFPRSESSHVLATFPPATSEEPGNGESPSTALSQCIAIAFVDRSRRPETEGWVFSSCEVPGRCQLDANGECPSCKSALLALLSTVSTLPLPVSIHDLANLGNSPSLSRISDPNLILFGAVSSFPANMLRFAIPEGQGGLDAEYMKYLFQTSTLPDVSELPPGLRWGKVRPQDFKLVRSRTAIPRQDATFALLPSLGIFPSDQDASPIAWSFLGLDASLTSLHVEPDWRGRGLAKSLGSKLFREGSSEMAEKDPGKVEDLWAHADVALENVQSRAVCRSLGGKESWTVFWIIISLQLLTTVGKN